MYKPKPYRPVRGDIVLYHDEAYYFQPHGTSCFLYDRKEALGSPNKARWKPSRRMVTRAPPEAVVIYRPTPEEIKENEEWSRFVTTLASCKKDPISLENSSENS